MNDTHTHTQGSGERAQRFKSNHSKIYHVQSSGISFCGNFVDGPNAERRVTNISCFQSTNNEQFKVSSKRNYQNLAGKKPFMHFFRTAFYQMHTFATELLSNQFTQGNSQSQQNGRFRTNRSTFLIQCM